MFAAVVSTLSTLVLASPLALAGPVTIDDVATEMRDGRLLVAVTTSAPVEAKVLSAKVANRRLHLYVNGGRVLPDRQSFRTAVALPRTDYAKVEVPFGAGVECQGPITLVAEPPGVRASIGCPTAATSAEATRPVSAVKPASLDKAAPAVLAAAPVAPARAQLPPPAPALAAVPTATAPAAAPAQPGTGAPAAAPAAVAPAGVPAAPSTTATAAAAAVAAAPAQPAPRGSSMMFPALALIAVAVGAVLVTRRRAKRSHLIHILETAQLGPKRSLIVARVNGETMVLGSSEAGIALLGSLPRAGAASGSAQDAEPAAAGAQAVAPVLAFTGAATAPSALENMPLDEGGHLSRLFRRPQRLPDAEKPAEPGSWKTFHDLLEESMEDQDLRRKLASGRAGKVT